MKRLGIKSVIRRKKYRYQSTDKVKFENVLKRNFVATIPLEKCRMDITYIQSNCMNKFMFLCAIKDLYNNEIISYETGTKNYCELVSRTLSKFFILPIQKNCIVHTGQGFQFARSSYAKLLEENNVIRSLSRRGNCWDNAPIESFFAILKRNLFTYQKNYYLKQR